MGDHAEDRQNDDIHFRMSEVPTQMLHHGLSSEQVSVMHSAYYIAHGRAIYSSTPRYYTCSRGAPTIPVMRRITVHVMRWRASLFRIAARALLPCSGTVICVLRRAVLARCMLLRSSSATYYY